MSRQLTLDDDLDDIVQAIERQTGLTEAAVIRAALQEKLVRIDREREAMRRLDELKFILDRLTPPVGNGSYMTNAESDAWMYDEHGLPH
jgi:hypothetical protein